MDKGSIADTLKNFYLFAALDPDQIELMAEHCTLQAIPKGGSMFNRGDSARGLYILLGGQLKLGVTSPHGAEKVISLISPGESFGEAILFLERQFPVYAQATMDAVVLIVPKQVIFALLDNDPLVARKMLAGLSVRMHQLVQDIEMLSLQSSTQRLIDYLLLIGGHQPGHASIILPASKTNIASLLNLTPETLSRTMLKLQQAGLIEVRGKEITIVDAEGLRRFGASL